ncbi:MAG: MBL fold metallo-hydrolase [Promethearchaeota archaeon]
MTVTITVYGGAGEIGANKILVEDKGHEVRFFLDFGKSFETMREYYDFPVSPNSLEELIQISATPNIANLYDQPGKKKQPASDIDAVLLSHAHTDHSGYIPLLNRSIPIHMGECTRRIFDARLQGARKVFDTDIEGLKIKTFRTGERIKIGNVEAYPIHVDHSIPAAYGFIIHCSEASIVYTGDFRRHGTRPQLTQDFVNAVQKSGEPDVVLCEGTNIAKAEIATEQEVQKKLSIIIKECKSLTIADFSEADFDRFRTVQNVATENDRELIIEPRRMWILYAINQCRDLQTPNVIDNSQIRWFDSEKKRISKYERLLREAVPKVKKFEEQAVTAKELHKHPQRFVFCSSFGSISTIQRIKPPASGIYILSASEPFNEESEISFDKLLNWLALSGLAMYTAHCSGHAHPIDIRQTLEEIQPSLVIPIHTEEPELFQKFVKTSGLSFQIPKQGISIKIA